MCLGPTSSLEFYGCFRCCYRKCFDFSRLVRHGNTFTDKSELKYLMPISCRDQPVTSPTKSHPNHVFDTRNLRLPTFLHTFASFTAPPNNYLHTRPALTLFGCPGGFLTLPCTVKCSTVRIQHINFVQQRSPVVELVKLMAWRQAKSLMNIQIY